MATKVRTGLMTAQNIDLRASSKTSVLDQLEHRKPIRQHIKEFACIFSVIGCGVAGYGWYYQGSLSMFVTSLLAVAALFIAGYRAPIILYPVWKAWMTLAVALGFIVTTIILFFMWLGVFIPLALLLRAIGKRVMDTTFDRTLPSYWNERDEKFHDFKLLERQF